MTYSVGPCSVCGEMGDALFVQCVVSGRLFFYCPSCGVAWDRPTQEGVVDSFDAIADHAPAGIRLPTLEDIEQAGLGHLIARSYPDSWDERVAEHLAR